MAALATDLAHTMHIAYIIGTRPEVVRSARLLNLLADDPGTRLTLINTGQHYDFNMLGAFLDELGVPEVTVDLGIGAADPIEQTAAVISQVARVISEDPPDGLCVFGDTNSSLAGAIAAARLGVPLAHIESGCRSFDMTMPEEINRRLIDHLSNLLLAVSEVGRSNLVAEGVPGRIEVVGDPLYDVLSRSVPVTERPSEPRRSGLITLHRPHNVDDPSRLQSILAHLDDAAREAGIIWTFPVHPRTRRALGHTDSESINFVDPFPYKQLLATLREAAVCVTDSGGLQKEALWMKVPCVTVRPTTEWLETLWQNANVLAPFGSDIGCAVLASLEPADRDYSNPYGDGHASEAIQRALRNWIADGPGWVEPALPAVSEAQ